MPRWIAIPICLSLSACSVYRSDGRKFLESNLNTIGVKISAYVEACDYAPVANGEWQPLKQTELADVYSGGEEFGLRVIPRDAPDFHCDYRLPNAKMAFEQTDAAITHTLEQLAATPKPSAEDRSSL